MTLTDVRYQSDSEKGITSLRVSISGGTYIGPLQYIDLLAQYLQQN